MSARVVPIDQARALKEAAYFIRYQSRSAPLWKRRLDRTWTRLGRTVLVELSGDLRLVVRDPATLRILAQSKPAQFDNLDWCAGDE